MMGGMRGGMLRTAAVEWDGRHDGWDGHGRYGHGMPGMPIGVWEPIWDDGWDGYGFFSFVTPVPKKTCTS